MMHQRMWSWGAARQDAKLGLTSSVRAPHCLVRCKTRWGEALRCKWSLLGQQLAGCSGLELSRRLSRKQFLPGHLFLEEEIHLQVTWFQVG